MAVTGRVVTVRFKVKSDLAVDRFNINTIICLH